MSNNTFYKTIIKGVIFDSFFGIAYFTVDGLLKLAGDQNKFIKEILSQLEEHEDCEEKMSQLKE